jgi:Mg-chelatase subunit ChlD
VAIAIVYDTSGSMLQPVKDAAGNSAPKYQVANRAVEAIVTRLEKFSKSSGKKLKVGLFTFSGSTGKAVVPLAPFEPKKLRDWIAGFDKPQGGTPLGNASAVAARALIAAKAGARHVLVITDGENTLGEPPEKSIAQVSDEAIKAGHSLYFHFVAFDVNAAVFAGIKKQGATLVSAADEKQLNDKLTFVLEEKILLEKE